MPQSWSPRKSSLFALLEHLRKSERQLLAPAVSGGARGKIRRFRLAARGNPGADQPATVGNLDGVALVCREPFGELADGQNGGAHVGQNTSDKKNVNRVAPSRVENPALRSEERR